MLLVFSTKIVNNFWDTTLDSKSLALKMFEAKTFEAGSLMQIYWSSRCQTRDFHPLKTKKVLAGGLKRLGV